MRLASGPVIENSDVRAHSQPNAFADLWQYRLMSINCPADNFENAGEVVNLDESEPRSVRY